MNKKIIIITILLIVISSVFILLGIDINKTKTPSLKSPEKIEVEENTHTFKNVEVDQFEIKQIDMKQVDNYYLFNFEITNKGSNPSSIVLLNFVFLDENNKKIGTIESELQPIAVNETFNYELRTTNIEFFNAATLKVEVLN